MINTMTSRDRLKRAIHLVGRIEYRIFFRMDQQENMGLEKLNIVAGGKIAFWCPVDVQKTMVEGSEVNIRDYVREMVDTLGGYNGGLVSMAYSSPDAVGHAPGKTAAMCLAFREYGIYDA